MQIRISASAFALANAPVESLTQTDVAIALAEMRADPRVSHASYRGPALGLPQRPVIRHPVEIKAVDTAEGTLDGVYSIGRILNALAETEAEHRSRIAAKRTECGLAAERAREAASEAEAVKAENLSRLVEAGIRPESLARYVNCVARGVFIDPDDRSHDDYAWYCLNIVRGGDRPMELRRYLANFS